jgi:hypothetical protein
MPALPRICSKTKSHVEGQVVRAPFKHQGQTCTFARHNLRTKKYAESSQTSENPNQWNFLRSLNDKVEKEECSLRLMPNGPERESLKEIAEKIYGMLSN